MSEVPPQLAWCETCRSVRIPGLAACPNCGDRYPDGLLHVVLDSIDVPDDPLPDRYTRPSIEWATINRAITEARALEYATDTDSAIAIYERLIQTRTVVGVPYQRLAILYRRLKRPADEERVVRLALAHIPCVAESWFVLRLAKILAEQRKRGPG